MPVLYPSAFDGTIYKSAQSWAGARDATSGDTVSDSSANSILTHVKRASTRGGGEAWTVRRYFMRFDTSGITDTISNVTIKIRGSYNGGGGAICVKADGAFSSGSPLGSLGVADFDAIDGWSAGSSNNSNVTKYTNAIGNGGVGNWNGSGYNAFTATSDLLDDMRNNNFVEICVLDQKYDLQNASGGLSLPQQFYVSGYQVDNSGTSEDPHISYTLGSGYAHDVNSVSAASIGKTNTVAVASIGKINTVD